MADLIPNLAGPALTLGPMVAGGLTAVGLSAIVGFQTMLYFFVFRRDNIRYAGMVAWIWLIDTAHTISVCIVIWQYGVVNFTFPQKMQEIVPAFPINTILTVIATVNANMFYTWRIHQMSGRNWGLTATILFLCFARTFLGIFLAVEMLLKPHWHRIFLVFKIPRTLAYTVSAITDVVIFAGRYYYLRELEQGYGATQQMVDSVVLFTVNDGLLSCLAIIATTACFLSMSNNFIWIGIYFNVAKLFANSILATLNLRNWHRHSMRPMGIPLTRTQKVHSVHRIESSIDKKGDSQPRNIHGTDIASTMEVFVEQEIEYNAETGKIAEQGSVSEQGHSSHLVL